MHENEHGGPNKLERPLLLRLHSQRVRATLIALPITLQALSMFVCAPMMQAMRYHVTVDSGNGSERGFVGGNKWGEERERGWV